MTKLSNLFEKMRNDRGDSALVTTLLVFPLFFCFLMTIVDTGIYMANRSVINQTVHDSARTVAILGGSGTANAETPLEKAYGEQSCEAVRNDASLSSAAKSTILGLTTKQADVECSVARRLYVGGGLTNVSFKPGSVLCGPNKAMAVGSETYCQVAWTYGGVPGAALSFMKGASGKALWSENTTKVTAESEVSMVNISCVLRPGKTTVDC